MSKEKIFIKDDVVAEILKKATEDSEFKALLFSNLEQALAKFDVVIPGASTKNYAEAAYAAFERAEFYTWFKEEVQSQLRDETISIAPGPCITDSEHDDVDWDFEVTKYKP